MMPVSLLVMLALNNLSAAQAQRPNIVLLLADDMRADSISALGNPHIRTPHLDSLVSNGVSFRNAYIMGAGQGAVCVPSRAMLLTGRSLFHLPNFNNAALIPPRMPTYPQLLRQAGYATFVTGKWHNDRASLARSFAAGGKIFFGGMSSHSGLALHHRYDPAGKFTGRGEPDESGKYSSAIFADEAIEFLQTRKDQKEPFYLHVAFTAPHDPREVPEGYGDVYDPAKLPLPKNFLPRHPFDNGEMKVRDEELSGLPREADWMRRELAAYYAMITHLDAQVGRIFEALRASGRDKDTIIIFAADNGLALGSHGLLGKQNLYEHSVKVPLIISGAGIAAGRTSDGLCYLLDLFPTICQWTGIEPPQNDGQSLLPAIRGEARPGRPGLLLAYRDVQRAYRDRRFKVIEYNVNGQRRTQLFDLEQDHSETTDLAADPRHREKLMELRRKLAEAQTSEGDPQAGNFDSK
jgi:arylsulfatase A-like enzyme